MIVFATESGNVYYCMASHLNNQGMMDMKTLPVGQIQFEHLEHLEDDEDDGIQLILSKSKTNIISKPKSKTKSKSKSTQDQDPTDPADPADLTEQTNTTISTTRPSEL